MPRGKIHDSIANSVFGVIPVDLNAEMDKASKALGSRHRLIGHDDKAIEKITQTYKDQYPLDKLNQPLSYYLAKLHLTCDFCPAHPTEDSPVTIEGEAIQVSESDERIENLTRQISLKDQKIRYQDDYIWLLEDRCHQLKIEKQELTHDLAHACDDLNEMAFDFGLWLRQSGNAFGINPDTLEVATKHLSGRLAFKGLFKILLQNLSKIANNNEFFRLLRQQYMLVEKPRSLPYKDIEKSDRSTIEPENKKEQT